MRQKLVFRVHAIKRMFKRRIDDEEVRHVIETGDVIEQYPEDDPYPSKLMLGWVGSRPIHVVIAYNKSKNETIIVTAYEPDENQWDKDFRRRK